MTREHAAATALVLCGTDAPHVVELVLLEANGSRVEQFKARRALAWFDCTGDMPVEAQSTETPSSPAIEQALDAIRWTLYGHQQDARLKAATRFAAITKTIGRTA